MTSPVMQALAQARVEDEAVFEKWCKVRGISSLPASPSDVVSWVRGISGRPMDEIWAAVQVISHAHTSRGLSDPTAGGIVGYFINGIAKIDSPASWPKEEKQLFGRLPYSLQVYLRHREKQRNDAVRRAQNEAADLRKELAAIKQPGKTDGNIQNQTAA